MPKHSHSNRHSRSHRRTRLATAIAAAATLTTGLLTLTTAPATAAPTAAPTPLSPDEADFNGDGTPDTAISAPTATVAGKAEAGQLVIAYGGGATTTPRTLQTLSQNTPGIPGTAEKGDSFGADTAYGDFNGDYYDDLAVSAPGEDVGTDTNGGTVQILWGSPDGLKRAVTVTDPRPTRHDHFGSSLEAADFENDGGGDLAIGSGSGAATIDVLKGGFTDSGVPKARYTIRPAIQSGDGTGPLNLHSGDVNGDERADLIVDGFADDGEGYNANFMIPGTPDGLSVPNAHRLPGGLITDVGDTNEDGYGDIVIGLTWDEGIEGAHKGGTVHIVHGNPNGPYGSDQAITQDSAGVPGAGETNDAFGGELDLGDINGDGHLDLVVGAPGENLDGFTDAGAVTVLYGAADGSGITTQGAAMLSQNTPGVPNSNENHDFFGQDVHIDDLNRDGRGDLVVGASGENTENGAVYVLNSRADGTFSSPTGGIYPSSASVSTSGRPRLGVNIAD
ncbi:FG-GAP repeat protein [Actinomycetota bacterium Odt1-20B]